MSARSSSARDQVVAASLHLAAAEWNNGRITADASMSLDFAHDLLDEALTSYVDVVIEERLEQGRIARP